MNINKQQYFYLISGLPDISMQDTHLPFSAKYFLDELKNKIEKVDFKILCLLYYPRDNRNLLHILFNKNEAIQLEGFYSFEELKKAVEEDVLSPRYMHDFIARFREDQSRLNELEWEANLTEAFFREAMQTRNEFLNQWMQFELNLKNILLLLSNRKYALPFSEITLQANEIAALMKENLSTDFGKLPSIDFMDQAVKIIETENLSEREKKVDALRWRKLEEMTFFNYFTVGTI